MADLYSYGRRWQNRVIFDKTMRYIVGLNKFTLQRENHQDTRSNSALGKTWCSKPGTWLDSRTKTMKTALIKKKIKFSSYIGSSCKVIYEEGLPKI
jgi:hypothetical protein